MLRWMVLAMAVLGMAASLEAAQGSGGQLPLVEVRTAGTAPTPRFAVMISGDGGWAKIDKSIAEELVKAGIPVVGLNALQYFWTKKAPDTVAKDLASIIESYAARWKAPDVIVIGYSRGADVLPFALNRLPAATRQRVALVALLSPSRTATFEFKVTDWFADRGGVPTRPEIDRMAFAKTICVYGTDDPETVCTSVNASVAQPVPLTGAHHFDGDYPALARIITSRLPQ